MRHMSALESLGQKLDQWGSLLLHLIMSKLDMHVARMGENVVKNNGSSCETTFRVFTVTILNSGINRIFKTYENSRKQWLSVKKLTTQTGVFAAIGETKYFLCKQQYTIYKCPSFLNLFIAEHINKGDRIKIM